MLYSAISQNKNFYFSPFVEIASSIACINYLKNLCALFYREFSVYFVNESLRERGSFADFLYRNAFRFREILSFKAFV